MNSLLARLTLAAACGMAAAPTVSHAVMPTYMKIEGVKGSVTSTAEVGSFHWLGALTPGGEFAPFRSASARGLRMVGGPHFDVGPWQDFSFTVQDATANTSEPVFQITMSDFMVSSAAQAGGSHDKWIDVVPVSQTIFRYRPLRPDGLRGDPVVGTWDIGGRFIGDLAVFDAFAEMGAVRGPDGTLSITSAVPEPATWALWLVGAAVAARRLRRLPR